MLLIVQPNMLPMTQERGGVREIIYFVCIEIKNLMPFNVSRKKINHFLCDLKH